MRAIIFSLGIFSLFCNAVGETTIYNTKGTGHVIPEWYVFKSHKNELAKMLGKDKSSKGLQVLRANDISKAVKKARAKIKQDNINKGINSNIEELQNTEYFVVARVADDVITNVDIINAIQFVFFSSGKKFERKYARLMIKPVLDALIEDKIRQRLARLNNINVSEETSKKIREIAQNNKLTVEELGYEFKKAGINMVIFKRNIASKIVFSGFFQSMLSSFIASPQAVAVERQKYKDVIKTQRYKLSEIFFRADSLGEQQVVRKKAESVIDLLNRGFSFRALAESISQVETNNKLTESEWINADSLDRQVYNSIKNLSPGEHTDIIQVRGGYKIIQIIDKADPNKEGISNAKYKVIVAEVPTPTPNTEEEAMSLELSINTISEADSVEVFKRACKVYGFKMMETTITEPDAIQRELILRNKSSGKSGIIRVSENEPLVALFVVSEEVPNASLPDDKFFSDMIINRKAVQEFVKMMKRQRLMTYVKVYTDKLDKVIRD